MKVRAKELCFVQGNRRREGEVFDYKGDKAPKFCEVVEADVPTSKAEAAEMDAEGIGKLKVKLAEYGIKVPRNATPEKLQRLIAEVEGKQTIASPDDEVI